MHDAAAHVNQRASRSPENSLCLHGAHIGEDSNTVNRFPQLRSIAFLGDYVPRRCGIATFTHHLCEAVAAEQAAAKCIVVAVNDHPAGYAYPERVRFQIEQKDPDSYLAAADGLNQSQADVLSVQHEFGIYGGQAGSHLLGLGDHVVFYNRFVSNDELKNFVGAADIYLTPYPNENQITSGALARRAPTRPGRAFPPRRQQWLPRAEWRAGGFRPTTGRGPGDGLGMP